MWYFSFFFIVYATFFSCTSQKDTSSIELEDTSLEESTQVVTFYEDLQPIINRACIFCHSENGRSFSMAEPDLVVLFADIIARDVRERGKPPWIADPSCRDYHGSGLYLTEAEIDKFEIWAQTGTPLGDSNNAQAAPPMESIAPYDTEIILTPGFDMPDWEANICIFQNLENTSDLRIQALEFATNDINVVHHSTLFLLPNNWNGSSEPFPCSWAGEQDWKTLAAWRPGAKPIQFSEGQGFQLPPNSKLMSQVYLINEQQQPHPFDKEARWGITFAEEEGIGYHVERIEINQYTIPKDATAHIESLERTWNYPDATILGVTLRSDILNQGQWFRFIGDEEQCVAETGGNDGLNPMTYIFTEPISITNGEPFEIGCQWNNSHSNPKLPTNQPNDVFFGYNSSGSLCSAEFIVEWK